MDKQGQWESTIYLAASYFKTPLVKEKQTKIFLGCIQWGNVITLARGCEIHPISDTTAGTQLPNTFQNNHRNKALSSGNCRGEP